MAITAAMVKELREMTGAGMMDCKKALNETNGDMGAAVEYLRKNGQAKAEKKAGRIAAEGLCRVAVKDEKTAAVVEVNSETDFVAKNEDFQAYVEAVAKQAVESDAADLDAFLAEKWHLDEAKTVKDALVDKVAVIGENLKSAVLRHSLDSFQSLDSGTDCLKVGEHAAQPSLIYIVHSAALSLCLNRILRLLLGSYKEDCATLCHHIEHCLVSLVHLTYGLLQVNNMNAVSLREDIGSHLRVPSSGLVSEVNACLQ